MTNINCIKINGKPYPIEGLGNTGGSYTLTEADKQEIVQRVLDVLDGWLFKDQYLDTTPNKDLPAPEPGKTYALMGPDQITGEVRELATAVCDENGDLLLNFADEIIIIYHSVSGWHFHPYDSMSTSGTVSVKLVK